MLQRNQMKRVFGGYEDYDTADCSADCTEGRTVSCSGSNCNAVNGSDGYCSAGGTTKYC